MAPHLPPWVFFTFHHLFVSSSHFSLFGALFFFYFPFSLGLFFCSLPLASFLFFFVSFQFLVFVYTSLVFHFSFSTYLQLHSLLLMFFHSSFFHYDSFPSFLFLICHISHTSPFFYFLTLFYVHQSFLVSFSLSLHLPFHLSCSLAPFFAITFILPLVSLVYSCWRFIIPITRLSLPPAPPSVIFTQFSFSSCNTVLYSTRFLLTFPFVSRFLRFFLSYFSAAASPAASRLSFSPPPPVPRVSSHLPS